MNNSLNIAVVTDFNQKQAQQIAHRLNLPCVNQEDTHFEILIVPKSELIELQFPKQNLSQLTIDFFSGKLAYRKQHIFQQNELIAKAIGIKKIKHPKIIDVTAGLGRDAYIMAALGGDVLMLERSDILCVLLESALSQLGPDKHIKLKLICADSIRFLENLNPIDYPEVIYCDPMFPSRKKSALVKKEMRILKMLVGDDEDATQLFKISLTKATKRVVVKRPKLAGFLNDEKPDIQYHGKSMRFDVYFPGV